MSDDRTTSLDLLDPRAGLVELKAAGIIVERLKTSGAPPYSLCEARLTAAEYAWLLRWAERVPASCFRQQSPCRPGSAMLVLALMSEWNRRESDGDAVYQGIPKLFADANARSALFLADGNARQALRDLLREATHVYRDCRLRHAFGSDEETDQRWYLTVQLQFGFCRRQIDRVVDWLRGIPPTEAMQRLLSSAGPQRSRSFQKLIDVLRMYRRDRVTELSARRELEKCDWILPEWIPELLGAARALKAGADEVEGDDAEHEQPSVNDVTIGWRPHLGPGVIVRLNDLNRRLDQSADRYHLRSGKTLLASWIAQPADENTCRVEYRVDRDAVELAATTPDLVLHVEDDHGAIISTESVPIWDASEDIQVVYLGVRHDRVLQGWRSGRDVAVLMRLRYVPSSEPDEWYITGYRTPFERKWLRYRSAPPSLKVADEAGRIVWEAVSPPSPTWTRAIEAELVSESETLRLGDRFHIALHLPPGADLEWIVADGRPVEFEGLTRQTYPLELSPEIAISGCKLRIGMAFQGQRFIHRLTLPVSCVGMAQQLATGRWRRIKIDTLLSSYEAQRGLFRVFTAGPDLLFEGYEVHGRRDSRPRRLPQIVGTGAALSLGLNPYHIRDDDRVPLAGGVVDYGEAVELERPAIWDGRLRIRLRRSLIPTDKHFILLWSSRDGLYQVDSSAIEVEDQGYAWSFTCPWAEEPRALLAAPAFEGYRLGFAWTRNGQWHRFFFKHEGDHPGLTPRHFLALNRWLRLPALLENRRLRHQPFLQEYAHLHTADLLAVAIFDDGLADLPGVVTPLHFDDSVQSNNAFESSVRQILFDLPLTDTKAAEIDSLFEQRFPRDSHEAFLEKMFLSHPQLAARVVQSEWLPKIPPSHRKPSSRWFAQQRFRLAGFEKPPSPQEYRAFLERTLSEAAKSSSKESRQPTDDFFIKDGLVKPGIAIALRKERMTPFVRHNFLVALNSAAFRQYFALQLLEDLENQI